MGTPAWSTPQLAEFVAAISAAENESSTALVVVERAAEALGADVAAIVGGGELVAVVGYPEGTAPVGKLEGVRPGADECSLEVPGVGACPAAAASLEHPPGSRLVIARQGARGLTPEETALLRAMARVASMTMRTLRVLDKERGTREELERLAHQQAALRRVATLIARGEPPRAVFAAVAEEVGGVLGIDIAAVSRYDPDGVVEVVGGWSKSGSYPLVGNRRNLGGRSVATRVFESNQPARVDHYADESDALPVTREMGVRAAAGVPVSVQGRLWGVMAVASTHDATLPLGIEDRLAQFTGLLATAIANAQARDELRRVADEQAALRRVATLVAQGDAPEAVFASVAEEVGRVFSVAAAAVVRYASDETAMSVAAWRSVGSPDRLRTVSLGGHNVATLVWKTGRPARVAGYTSEDDSQVSALARGLDVHSAVGAPVIVGGRLWGALQVLTLAGQAALPAGTEERLADFAELAATAIANAQARDELRRVADEQAALRHVATLVARGVPATEIFDAVAEETRRVVDLDASSLTRFESDGTAMLVAADSRLPLPNQVGDRFTPDPGTTVARVQTTGRPARVEAYEAAGPISEQLVSIGYRGSVGAPVVVGGRVWGVLNVLWTRDSAAVPGDTEERLVQFAELLATAIANAQAQAELTASRARIVATADATRRQLVRDLHDGAQQRLVHTIITLKLARRASANDHEQGTEPLIGEALDHAERANAELRELVHGILPSALTRGGLAAGVEELVARLHVPVSVNMTADRFAPEIEANAYFVVAEALTNVAKHSRARIASVMAWLEDGLLRMEVWDDGVGGARPAGSGLLGLRDRVVALGGRLRIDSPRGAGTRIEVELPLDAVAADSR